MKSRGIIIAALIIGLTLGLAGMASAATISCGQCHGAYINNIDGTKTLMPGVSTLEDTKTPQTGDICDSTGRGLHGIHMNYSSASYGKKGTTRGNCNYCHNGHIHENGYVEFEGYSPDEALGTIASSSAVTLNAGGSGYAPGDIASINGGTGGAVTVSTVDGSGAVLTFSVSSWRESYGYAVSTGVATTNITGTGTGLTVNVTSITNYGLRQLANSTTLSVSGVGITSDGLDIMQMDGKATCTGACHKGTSSGNPAPWGNYTSASIRLSCLSCHDDVVNKTGLSGAHAAHLNSTITVNGGQLMGAAGNAGCVNCHPDNTGDGRASVDDGSVKAYPHASDGTNVVSDNATIIAGVNATKNGLNTTCAGSCHQNTTTATWGDASLGCDACHYYDAAPTQAGNDAAAVKLGGSHSSHFGQGVACPSCHTVPGDTSHATALPPVPDNATILASLGWNVSAHTCSSTGSTCHGSNVTPDWTTPGTTATCAICHEYPGVAGRDWTGFNGHTVRYDAPVVSTHLPATGFNASTDTYAGVTGAGGACYKCHGGGTHRSGTVEVISTGKGYGNCGGDFTVTITTPGSDATCGNVKCHSGRTTPNWW